MKNRFKRLSDAHRVLMGLAVVLAGALPLHAATILNLTTAGASGFVNGGFFQQVPDQSTGTGVIEPFLRIQNNVTQSGYNTSIGEPLDTKGGSWTHDILVSAIPTVNLGGINYYQILLDINQTGANPLLSLNSLQAFVRSGPLTTVGTYNDLANNATKIFDLDSAGNDNRIELNYALNPGSGAGDMFAYLPVPLVAPAGSLNFYLYAGFGAPNASNDGFEEFAVVKGASVPDGGSTVAMLGAGLMLLAGIARRSLSFGPV